MPSTGNPTDQGNHEEEKMKRSTVNLVKIILCPSKKIIEIGLLAIFNLCIVVFLIFAILFYKQQGDCDIEWCDGLGMFIIIISLVYLRVLYKYVIKRFFGKYIYKYILKPINTFWTSKLSNRFVRIPIYLVPLVAVIIFLVFDTNETRERLKSCIGVLVILIFGFAFSRHPGQIRWRPVLWGLCIQFALGLITIRWDTGRSIFQCIADKVATFLRYSDKGAAFVYGDNLINDGIFAFQALSVIFFLSFVVQMLYYCGAMQWIVLRLGWLLQISMGTTICESVNAAASIFLSMSESPLLFKPLIKDLTKSELHAVMTGGFATVAGSVMAAYISFGVQPVHLLTASVMSAPAALCVSKLFYPETEQSKTTIDNIQIVKGDETGLLDAATKGALLGIQLVLGIIANLVAFVSFIAFMNGVLQWLGMLVGVEDFTLEFIFSKVFIPLAWVMGVEWAECEEVARLVGIKTIVNEFVAYREMGESKKAGLLSPRSEMIATYALCGFSNPGAIGILVGALSTLAPEQRGPVTEVAFRAFIAGCATCFLTASIAGMLSSSEDIALSTTANSTMLAYY